MPQLISYGNWRTSADDSTISEWVEGEMGILMLPERIHFELTNLLIRVLLPIVTRKRLDRVFHAPVEMRLPRLAREPDLVFLSTANLGRLDGMRVNGPADLAIEVVSDDSVVRDQIEKRHEYEAAGVREHWIVDPREGRRTCLAPALGEDGTYAPIEPDADGRIHSRVIPGLWLDPDWLWQDPLPMTLPTLARIAPDLVRATLDA